MKYYEIKYRKKNDKVDTKYTFTKKNAVQTAQRAANRHNTPADIYKISDTKVKRVSPTKKRSAVVNRTKKTKKRYSFNLF